KLLAYLLAEILVVRQLLGNQVLVGQLAHPATTVGQDHLVEALVGFRVLDDADEGRQAGASAQQIEIATGQHVIQYQSAGGLAADDDVVTDLDVLQAGGQGAIRHLDAVELHGVLVIRTSDTVGTHQRATLDFQTDHDEMAVLEAQTRITGGLEGEQGVGPVMYAEDSFGSEFGHRDKALQG